MGWGGLGTQRPLPDSRTPSLGKAALGLTGPSFLRSTTECQDALGWGGPRRSRCFPPAQAAQSPPSLAVGSAREGAPQPAPRPHCPGREGEKSLPVRKKPALFEVKAVTPCPVAAVHDEDPPPAFLEAPLGTGRPQRGPPAAFSRLHKPSSLSLSSQRSCCSLWASPRPPHGLLGLGPFLSSPLHSAPLCSTLCFPPFQIRHGNCAETRPWNSSGRMSEAQKR